MATSCPSCRRPLTAAEPRSKDSPGYCAACGDLVYAVRPNSQLPHEWFLVADPGPPEIGAAVDAGNQCEGCGLTRFTVVQEAVRAFGALCEGQVIEGEFRKGCKAQHPIRQKPAYQVVFPDPVTP